MRCRRSATTAGVKPIRSQMTMASLSLTSSSSTARAMIGSRTPVVGTTRAPKPVIQLPTGGFRSNWAADALNIVIFHHREHGEIGDWRLEIGTRFLSSYNGD